MRFKKIMASLGTLVCLSGCFNAAAYADITEPFVDDGISLAYEIANNPISDLKIVDRTASCTSSTFSKNAASITITQTLQKSLGSGAWSRVNGAEWTRTEARSSVRLSNSISGLDSGTYRVQSVFTLTDKNGKSETITIYSNEQKVP